jgi:inosine-uridine nucleoside N-ribohydrolase
VAVPDEAAYWPLPVTPAPSPFADALTLLKRSVEAGARVVAIGPYTNLALFDRAQPGLLARAAVYLMGGHVRPAPPGFQRWGAEQDFNLQYDVASARHLLKRLRPTLIPLEVTAQTALRRAHLPALRGAGSLGRLLAHQAEAFARDRTNQEPSGLTCAGLPYDTINFQHDPLACAVALGWDGVTIETLSLRPELRDGWLHLREAPAGRPTPVVTTVDGPRFNALWIDLAGAAHPRQPQ